MRRSVVLWIITIVMAAAAAAVRLWEFMSAYIIDTQLTIPMHPATITTIIVSAAAVLLIFLLRGKEDPSSSAGSEQLYFIIEFLAAAALIVSVYFDIRKAIETTSTSLFIFAALTALTVVVILANSRAFGNGVRDFTRGFYLTIPVFWGSYWIITDFWDHASNPVIFSYFYKMAAIIFTTLALHGAAGLYFGYSKARKTMCLAYCGLFFAVMTVISTILAGIFIGAGISAMTLTPGLMCRFIFVILHMSYIGLRAAPAEDESSEEDGEDEESELNEEI